MPVIKSAKKKLRQDRKRTKSNRKIENVFKKLIKQSEKTPTEKNIRKTVSVIDKAASKNIIHKNKAAKIKSSLSRLLNAKTESPKTKQPKKPKQKR